LGTEIDSYYDAQSGGRLSVQCIAFEWQQISMTTAQWHDAGALAGRRVYESMITGGVLSRDDFDHFVVLIDDNISSLGVTPHEAPETSIISAVGQRWQFTASNVIHELGHRLGAVHTWLDSPNGPIEYGGLFCVMGFENTKYAYLDQALIAPNEGAQGAIARFGPGMCFPNLVRAQWADPLLHAVRLTPYATGSVSGAIQIAALHGAPKANQANPPVACIVELDDWYVIEYRSTSSQYDAGVPNDSPPYKGDLVVYRTPSTGPFAPLQVGTITAEPGNILTIDSSPLAEQLAQQLAKKTGGIAGSPLKLIVTNVDETGQSVSFRVEKVGGRPPQYSRTEGLKDFMQWAISGRNDYDDPVLVVLKALAEISDLSRLRRISGPRDAEALGHAMDRRISNLANQVRRLHDQSVAPSSSMTATGPL